MVALRGGARTPLDGVRPALCAAVGAQGGAAVAWSGCAGGCRPGAGGHTARAPRTISRVGVTMLVLGVPPPRVRGTTRYIQITRLCVCARAGGARVCAGAADSEIARNGLCARERGTYINVC